ncbi:MAG: ATP-dependent helicase [Verrucomicrobiaceae bacterium]|nr:ATP-dependent helicase [Verrucomicrobiaceae bacterium]
MPKLDKSQQAFCDAPAVNIRLLAPAGCGKTLSILHRCCALHRLASSRATRFLVLTFTVAARDELKARLTEDPEFASIRDHVEITTLNAWGFRRIKSQTRNPRLLTNKDNKHFTILNQLAPVWAKHKAVKDAIEKRSSRTKEILEIMDALKALGFDHTRIKSAEEFNAHVQDLIDLELGWRLEELWETLIKIGILTSRPKDGNDPQGFLKRVYTGFYKFWLEATDQLIKSATFTLEDQKYFAFIDERQKGEDADKPLTGVAKYDHVIVDEFQDINPLDLNLVKAIVERHRATVTLVGDDDQAIYEWRGTTPVYILEPERFFASRFKTFTLQTNYRSPANIVTLAQKLIRHNQRRVDKDTQAFQTAEAEIRVEETEDINASLDLAAELVAEHIKPDGSPTRIALIGRKKAQLIPYQVYFASKNVPFCAAEDLQIFLSKTFDQLLELLEIKQRADQRRRPREVAADLLELCNLVKRYRLNNAQKEQLDGHFRRSVFGKICDSIDAVASYRGPLAGPNVGGRTSIEFADAIRSYLDATTVADAITALSCNFEGLAADFGKAEEDIFFKDPPFGQLAEYAQRYGDDYLQFLDDIETAKDHLAHVPPTDDEAPDSNDVQKRPVHLMTALRAKGKEFETVMVLDCVEDMWPMKYAQTLAQFEAERRVFYVAFTRAKKRVVFQTAKRLGKRTAAPSRYLSEIGLL